MHQTVSCGTTGSVGDLGRIARRLAEAGYTIKAVGGGESILRGGEVGIISLLVEVDVPDAQLNNIVDILTDLELNDGRTLTTVRIHPGFDVELDDTVGALADAAELLGEDRGGADAPFNIMSTLSIDAHGGWAIVRFAFEDEPTRDRAASRVEGDARFRVMPEHGGRGRRDRVDKLLDGRIKRGDVDEEADDDHGNPH
jgi:hypothetical protein